MALYHTVSSEACVDVYGQLVLLLPSICLPIKSKYSERCVTTPRCDEPSRCLIKPKPSSNCIQLLSVQELG